MKKQKLMSFGIFFLFLCIIFCMIPITYAINDDVAMRDIASGAMSGTPDYHLIFVKAALGLLLSKIYTYVPGIDWYGCLWMGFMILAAFFVLGRLLSFAEKKGKNLIFTAVMFTLLFDILLLKHLVNFQFTVVAAIIIGSAIFLYYTGDNRKQGFDWEALLVIFMIWLAFCVRTNVMIMAVPFGGLLFLMRKDSWKKKAVLLLITAVGLIGIFGFEQISYSADDWQTYMEYNEYRSMVYDYYGVPSYEEHQDFYQSIGMEEYDVVNLERYNLYFIEELETEKMRQVAEYAKELYLRENSLSSRIKVGIEFAVQGELEPENLVLNLGAKLLLFANLLFEAKRRKKTFWVNGSFLLCEGMLMFYLGFEGRLPARVGAALFIIELFAAAGICCCERLETETAEKAGAWKKWIAGAVLLFLGAGSLRSLENSQKEIYTNNLQNEQMEAFFAEKPENVYFVPVQFTAGYSENFHVKKEAGIKNVMDLGGWTSYSPVRVLGLQYCGIDGAVDAAIIELENLYIALTTPSSKLEAHYKEEYDSVIWTQVDMAPIFGVEVPVFRIERGENI